MKKLLIISALFLSQVASVSPTTSEAAIKARLKNMGLSHAIRWSADDTAEDLKKAAAPVFLLDEKIDTVIVTSQMSRALRQTLCRCLTTDVYKRVAEKMNLVLDTIQAVKEVPFHVSKNLPKKMRFIKHRIAPRAAALGAAWSTRTTIQKDEGLDYQLNRSLDALAELRFMDDEALTVQDLHLISLELLAIELCWWTDQLAFLVAYSGAAYHGELPPPDALAAQKMLLKHHASLFMDETKFAVLSENVARAGDFGTLLELLHPAPEEAAEVVAQEVSE